LENQVAPSLISEGFFEVEKLKSLW